MPFSYLIVRTLCEEKSQWRMAYRTGPESEPNRSNALIRLRAIRHELYALFPNEIRFMRYVSRRSMLPVPAPCAHVVRGNIL